MLLLMLELAVLTMLAPPREGWNGSNLAKAAAGEGRIRS